MIDCNSLVATVRHGSERLQQVEWPDDETTCVPDYRPTSNEDTCAGCGRSVRAPAGRIAIEDLEQSDLPGSYGITRHYGETRACTLPHGS